MTITRLVPLLITVGGLIWCAVLESIAGDAAMVDIVLVLLVSLASWLIWSLLT